MNDNNLQSTGAVFELSPQIKSMILACKKYNGITRPQANQPRIKVSQVLSSVAYLYEKIRTIIEYKGEHLLRRNAIERMLKRLMWEKRRLSANKIAEILIRELIWSRYVENDTLPADDIEKVGKIIKKYEDLISVSALSQNGNKNLLLGIITCEIEETVVPKMTLNLSFLQTFYDWISLNFEWKTKILEKGEEKIQLLMAIDRSLLKSDKPRIIYHLLKLHFPAWSTADVKTLKEMLPDVLAEIEKNFENPFQLRLYRFLQKQIAPFQILRDIFEKEKLPEIETAVSDPIKLEAKIREVCQSKYAQIDKKIRRGITRSIVYIFVTKVVLAMIIEIPYEVFLTKSIRHIPILINIVLPPALMYLVGLTIKRPDENNTNRIVERLNDFVYENVRAEKININLTSASKTGVASMVFSIIYALFFIITFGGILIILRKLGFNIIGGTIFFIFLSLVLLFGYRVRSSATELIVTGQKEGIISHLLTNLSLPLLNLGTYLSKGLAKLNFLMVIMDLLIEVPLKSVIAAVEEWSTFVTEKKDEMIEVPEN